MTVTLLGWFASACFLVLYGLHRREVGLVQQLAELMQARVERRLAEMTKARDRLADRLTLVADMARDEGYLPTVEWRDERAFIKAQRAVGKDAA